MTLFAKNIFSYTLSRIKALWLKKNHFRPDQVQIFMLMPMSIASTMDYLQCNPLKPISYDSEKVVTVKKGQERCLYKVFLRYHAPENWQIVREWLRQHGHINLIGTGSDALVLL